MKRPLVVAATALCLSAVLAPADAKAQSTDQWNFAANIYGWFPSISGKATFPPTGETSEISVDASKLIKNLKFVFMGTLDARKGRWGAFTDIVYTDVGDSKSETRDLTIGGRPLPGSVNANVNLDVKNWVWTLAGYYRFMEQPGFALDALAGVRYLDIQQKLSWELTGNIGDLPLPGRDGSGEVSDSSWDAIVGVKGRFAFGANHAWFVPYYVDVGTGQSDLTWQAMAGLGYRFNWGEIIGAWRYLDYDFDSGKPMEDMTMSGPAVAVVFRW